jgi:hypothetical protein
MPMSDRSSGSLLSIQFSAYSPNGLLYFRGGSGGRNVDFLAVELVDGTVAVKARLANIELN